MSEGQFNEKTLKRAEFCKSKCPSCVKSRKKDSGISRAIVKIEDKLGLCPWCRAYRKVYGVHAYENPPD
jgi:hypothetical protein